MIISDLLRWWMLQILWNVGTHLPEYMVTSQETVFFCVSAMISAILHNGCVLCCRGIICVAFMRHVACSCEYPIPISLRTRRQSSGEAICKSSLHFDDHICGAWASQQKTDSVHFLTCALLRKCALKFPALLWVTYLERKFTVSKQFLSSVYPPFYFTSLLMIEAVLCSFWTANKTWVQEVKNYCSIGYFYE